MSLSAKNLPFGFQNASLVSLSHSGAQLLAPLCGALGVGAVSDLQIQSHPSRDIQCYLHLRLSWHCQFKSICMYEQKMVPENVTTKWYHKKYHKRCQKMVPDRTDLPFQCCPFQRDRQKSYHSNSNTTELGKSKIAFYIEDLLFKYI